MKQTFLVLILLIGLSTNLHSQSECKVISLKDGTELIGNIIESVPGEFIRVKESSGLITKIEDKYIKDITGERIYKPKEQKITGYRGFVDFGYTFGTGDFSVSRLELLTSHGVQMSNMFFLGGGTGFNYYCTDGASDFLIPFFGDFRVNFMNGPISPILGIKAGVSFNASDSFNYLGFYLAPSIGVRYAFSSNFATNFTIGYTHQRLGTIEYYDGYGYGYYNYGYNSKHINTGGVSLKIGIEF